MEQTYCSKHCENCAQKDALNCPGCKAGPGRPVMGQCEIARCAQEKGYENCEKCGYMSNCFRRTSRINTPAVLRGNRSAFLGKWMMVLFLLFIPNTIGGWLSDEPFVTMVPGLFYVGTVINIVCRIAYGAVLLKMSSQTQYYSTAGFCTIGSICVIGLIDILFGTAEPPLWAMLISLVGAVIGLVGMYNEYMGHSTVLYGINGELSGKWYSLWTWTIGLYLALIGCMVLAVLIPLLGILGMLGSAIGMVVVNILRLVYLWKSAKYFKDYRA